MENRLSRRDSVGFGLDYCVCGGTVLHVDPITYSGYCIGRDTFADLETNIGLQRLTFFCDLP